MDGSSKTYPLTIVDAAAALWVALACWIILTTGSQQFGGFDGSIVSNGSWQFYNGLHPYRDFLTAVPPLFLIGGKTAFLLFGTAWHSLVLITALFCAVTSLLQWWLLRRAGIGAVACLIAVVATSALTSVQIGWWWYNHTTAAIAALMISATMSLLGRPDRIAWAAFTAIAALTMLAKINVAAPLIVLLYATLLLRTDLRKRAAVSLAAAAAAAILVLLAAGINSLTMLASDRQASGRISLYSLHEYLVVTWSNMGPVEQLCGAAIVLIPVWIGIARRKVPDLRVLVALIALLVSLIAMSTNAEWKEVDMAPAVAGAVLLADSLPERRLRVVATAIGTLGALGFVNASLHQAFDRSRVRTVGPGAFFEEAPLTELQEPPYLRGLLVGPRMTGVVREMQTVLTRCHAEESSAVYFGPRVDFGYPAFRIRNRPGMPLWWGGNGEMHAEVEQTALNNFARTNYDLCMFLRRDYTWFPQSLIRYLYGHYQVFEGDYVTVHVSRGWLRRCGLDAVQ